MNNDDVVAYMIAIKFMEHRVGHKMKPKVLASSFMKPYMDAEVARAKIVIAALRECPDLYLTDEISAARPRPASRPNEKER